MNRNTVLKGYANGAQRSAAASLNVQWLQSPTTPRCSSSSAALTAEQRPIPYRRRNDVT